MVEGSAGPMICQVAEDLSPDVVVVGSHGRGFLKRVVIGSVSEHVVRHCQRTGAGHPPRRPRRQRLTPVVDHGSDPVPTWSVAELHEALNGLLVHVFGEEVWIEGEMRNLNRSAKGHVYFDLVDAGRDGDPTRPMLSVTLFDKERQAVNRHLTEQGGAVRMGDGIRVRIRGRLNIYGARSSLQLRMSWIDPAYTLGVMGQERDRVLAVLAAEGLLGANAAAPMPLVPLHIALVTSINSAAHADALHELQRAGPGFRVTVVDTRTQGCEAERSIVAALGVAAERGAEVVLLVRGGGARTDLAAFDSELVARAIVASPLPVVTGIGHEIDRTVADEVAHSAHKTPTAAAAAVADGARRFALDLGIHLRAAPDRDTGPHRAGGARPGRGRPACRSLGEPPPLRRPPRGRRTCPDARRPRHPGRWTAPSGARRDRVRGSRPQRDVVPRQADSLLVGLRGTCPFARPGDRVGPWLVGDPGRRRSCAVRSIDQLAPDDRITTTLADGTVHSTVIGTDGPEPPGAPVSDTGDDQLTFAAAMDELTTLVDELESDALDVDDLTARVARAADLVQWCRERIDGARFSVEEVLVRLEADEPDAGPLTSDRPERSAVRPTRPGRRSRPGRSPGPPRPHPARSPPQPATPGGPRPRR